MTTTEHPTEHPTVPPAPTPGTQPADQQADQGEGLHVWVCEGCDLISHPHPARTAVNSQAAIHNGLTHGGWPAARVVDLPGICESCTKAPAALGLLLGLGITPFAVCTSCLHPHHTDQNDRQGDQHDGREGVRS